ncbi:MAG: hypothetical protein GF353_26770 [Candidatus Lokiarchaeota archaeon]|nr:hypothetical protein [Candidatus Lokiarchaeota archaeon]
MGRKKKKIREKFDEIFKSGNEVEIKSMLEENPWLLDELSEEMEDVITEDHQVVAAIGVMEDELNNPVPIDQIKLSLKLDFNIDKNDQELTKILTNIESLLLIKRTAEGWQLTEDGEKICDAFINKRFEEFV